MGFKISWGLMSQHHWKLRNFQRENMIPVWGIHSVLPLVPTMLCIMHICCVMCIGADLRCPRWVEIKYYLLLSHQFPSIHAIFTFSHVFSKFGNGWWCSTYLPTCHKPVWTLVDGHLQLSHFKVCFQLTITFSRPNLSPFARIDKCQCFYNHFHCGH